MNQQTAPYSDSETKKKRFSVHYKRFHALHLDILSLIVVTVALWLLPFLFEKKPAAMTKTGFAFNVSICETEQPRSLWNSPTLFAFRSEAGFSQTTPEIKARSAELKPPTPEIDSIEVLLPPQSGIIWPERENLFRMEPPPVLSVATPAGRKTDAPGRVLKTIPSPKEMQVVGFDASRFIRTLSEFGIPEGELKLFLRFGSNGILTDLVFAPNGLPEKLIASAEREMMRLTSTGNRPEWMQMRIIWSGIEQSSRKL